MADKTNIGWTTATWNPWYGCTHVSAGCDNCYMFRDMRTYGRDPEKVTRSKTKFSEPLRWTDPRVIFTCSWSDWFHHLADEWRPEAWDIVDRTRWHTYQILTKRTGRIHRHLPPTWGEGWPHVWLGASVEDADAMYRIRHLRETPAVVRFLSCEPLLGPLPDMELTGIHWVIVGGESGPDGKRRDMDPAWLADIVAQCKSWGVKVFVKQDSARRSEQQGRIPDDLWALKEMPA